MAIENQEARTVIENPAVWRPHGMMIVCCCETVKLMPIHELSLLWKKIRLSEGQICFQFDGHPGDEKGISKQLEIYKEDIIESFHSLVSFRSYDKD